MTEQELVKMSPKGQLVVPLSIRKLESFKGGDRFISFPVKEGVLFKRVKIPNVKPEFEKLAKEAEEQFKRQKITTKDVAEAVALARKK
jgi:bifunctional DNA-binding transcriptional regulator/antitoxin component of YhaV-PrlF toxin-antitoxin module